MPSWKLGENVHSAINSHEMNFNFNFMYYVEEL